MSKGLKFCNKLRYGHPTGIQRHITQLYSNNVDFRLFWGVKGGQGGLRAVKMSKCLKICNQLRYGHPTVYYTTIFEKSRF